MCIPFSREEDLFMKKCFDKREDLKKSKKSTQRENGLKKKVYKADPLGSCTVDFFFFLKTTGLFKRENVF